MLEATNSFLKHLIFTWRVSPIIREKLPTAITTYPWNMLLSIPTITENNNHHRYFADNKCISAMTKNANANLLKSVAFAMLRWSPSFRETKEIQTNLTAFNNSAISKYLRLKFLRLTMVISSRKTALTNSRETQWFRNFWREVTPTSSVCKTCQSISENTRYWEKSYIIITTPQLRP